VKNETGGEREKGEKEGRHRVKSERGGESKERKTEEIDKDKEEVGKRW
jgi:hypothetical protein